MPELPERVLLVDLCGTLYRSNTTFDFLREFLGNDPGYSHFEASERALLRRVANRLRPGDRRRERAISFLQGNDKAALSEAAAQFLATLAPIDEVHALVARLRADHDRTVLVSSSLDFIVEAACRRLGFDGWHATELAYEGNVCNGSIERDLLGKKHELIPLLYAGKQLTLVSDNTEDVRCKPLVEKMVGVADAHDEARVAFWSNRVDDVVVYR